jgi:hypothetical protein
VKGKDYVDGIDGRDYVLTSKDKTDIANRIDVPIVEKIIEKTEVIREVPIEIDVSMVKGAVSEKYLKKKVLDGMALIDGRIKLIDQRWGAHGGGVTRVYTDATLTGIGTASSPLSVVGGSGGTGYSIETPSGTVDGNNVTFTVTNTPVFVMGDGVMYFENAGYTISGTTVTMDSPPSYSIRSFYGGSGTSVTNVWGEVVSGSGTSFTLAHTPSLGTVRVFALGQRLALTTDYTITSAIITTVGTWSATDLLADYQY